jgi:glutamine synthetase
MREEGVQQVKLGGFDIDGILRGKYISLEKFASAAREGFGFCDVIFGWDANDVLYDNARFTGWHTGYPDTLARIDLSTYRLLPWEKNTAFFIADFHDRDGGPLAVSPRQALRRVIERAHRLGYVPTLAAEYEFFFFRETAETVRQKHYRDMRPLTPGMFGYSVLRSGANADFVHQILDGMRAFDVPLEGFHTETGPGVYEAAIRYDEALAAADKAALFKTMMRVIAARNDCIVTFMAKWNEELPGCGGHLHQSLSALETHAPVFHDPAKPHGFSDEMRHYIGGQLTLMGELTALSCPTVNSYKRLVPGTWAPTTPTWGIENRTCTIRAIPGNPKATRVEYRLPGADANPYLAMAASLASGIYGIEHRIEPGEPTLNGYEAHENPLPRTLEEATARLQSSTAAVDLFGEAFVDHFVRTRQWECRQYQKAVTDWERSRYFEII